MEGQANLAGGPNFYALTRIGRGHLGKEAANWERLSGAISQLVRLTEAWRRHALAMALYSFRSNCGRSFAGRKWKGSWMKNCASIWSARSRMKSQEERRLGRPNTRPCAGWRAGTAQRGVP